MATSTKPEQMERLTGEQLESCREYLDNEINRLTTLLINHPPINNEREKGLNVIFRKKLDEMVSRLEAIGDGTYAICKKCQNPIEATRLVAYPPVSTCAQCHEKHGKNQTWR